VELRRRLKAAAGSLQFSAREAEHWRTATEAARERLAGEQPAGGGGAAGPGGGAGQALHLYHYSWRCGLNYINQAWFGRYDMVNKRSEVAE